jgi:hypothetical protein
VDWRAVAERESCPALIRIVRRVDDKPLRGELGGEAFIITKRRSSGRRSRHLPAIFQTALVNDEGRRSRPEYRGTQPSPGEHVG